MSDDDDDELMALAGVGSDASAANDDEYEPQIKTSSRRGAKRQLNEDEEEDVIDIDEDEELYPLEGKFKNEEDRAKLMAMDEVTREQILYDRTQEKEKRRERKYLALRARQTRAETSALKQGGSKSKRLRTSKLSELKRQREQKNRKKKSDDYEDEENLDDLIEDDEDDRDLDELAGYGEENDDYYDDDEYEPTGGRKTARRKESTWDYDANYQREATLEDINKKVRASRSLLNKFLYRDEFDSVIPGSYVRVNIGISRQNGQPQYRMAKVEEVKRGGKPYKLFGKPCNTYLTISEGETKRDVNMAYISNSPFTKEELDIFQKRLTKAGMDMPSVGELQDKMTELSNMSKKKLTNDDINKMVTKREELIGSLDTASMVRKLASLRGELQVAVENTQMERAHEITKEIQRLTTATEQAGVSKKMSRINLRNRKTNEELIKRAERRKIELQKQQAKDAKEDPNDPFSKLAREVVAGVDRKDAVNAATVNCIYRREGLKAAVKDIPLKVNLKL